MDGIAIVMYDELIIFVWTISLQCALGMHLIEGTSEKQNEWTELWIERDENVKRESKQQLLLLQLLQPMYHKHKFNYKI